MKIPKQITGKNKIRDFDICTLYIKGYSPAEIKAQRNLAISVRRIEQIVYENKNFVKSNIEWHKTKRVNKLERQLRKKEENNENSKKDILDIIEALRKEIEGDKPLIDQSTKVYQEVRVIVENDDDIRNRVKANFQNASESGFNYQR